MMGLLEAGIGHLLSPSGDPESERGEEKGGGGFHGTG
jgi:hypothetical protein